MAHFAKIENNIVTQVIVASQEFVDALEGTWIQTSYNTRGGVHYGEDGLPDNGVALRKNYAGTNFVYNSELDMFHPPQPYDSWTLNTTTGLWDAPVPCPGNPLEYKWNESTKTWQQL